MPITPCDADDPSKGSSGPTSMCHVVDGQCLEKWSECEEAPVVIDPPDVGELCSAADCEVTNCCYKDTTLRTPCYEDDPAGPWRGPTGVCELRTDGYCMEKWDECPVEEEQPGNSSWSG